MSASVPPAATRPEPQDEQAVQSMLDRYYDEVRLFWTRFNVLVVVNAGALSLLFPVWTGERASPPAPLAVATIVAAGVLTTLCWLLMNHFSARSYRTWLVDAARIVRRSEALRARHTATFGDTWDAILAKGTVDEPSKPLYWLTMLIVLVVMAVWILLGVTACA